MLLLPLFGCPTTTNTGALIVPLLLDVDARPAVVTTAHAAKGHPRWRACAARYGTAAHRHVKRASGRTWLWAARRCARLPRWRVAARPGNRQLLTWVAPRL